MHINSTEPIRSSPAKGTTVIITVLIVLILWLSLYIPFFLNSSLSENKQFIKNGILVQSVGFQPEL